MTALTQRLDHEIASRAPERAIGFQSQILESLRVVVPSEISSCFAIMGYGSIFFGVQGACSCNLKAPFLE